MATKRAERLQDWAFWAVPLGLAFAFLTKIWDRDLWWHLATGRFIVEHGYVPDRDSFSYTAEGLPFRYVTTGSDLLLYGVERIAGPAGLSALKTLTAAVLLVSLAWSCRSAGARRGPTLAAIIAATVLVEWRYSLLRPATLGAAVLALHCALLYAWWQRPARWRLVVTIIVVALWPTVHATAVLAPVLVLVTLLATVLVRDRREHSRDLAAASVVSSAVIVLLPAGRGAIASTYAHLSNPDLTVYLSEWAPGDVRSPRFWLPLLSGVLGIALGRRVLVQSPLPLAFWALGVLLTFGGVRNQYEAIVLGVPLAALGVDALMSRLEAAGLRIAAPAVLVAWPLGALAALLLLEHGPLLATWWGVGVRVEATPEDCVNVLERLPRGRVLNDLDTGGYLIWRRIPVFSDGRAMIVYPRETFERWFIPAFQSPQGLLKAADAFGVSYGLGLQHKSLGQMMMASPDWIPVFHGLECSLFVRPAAAQSVVRAGRPLLEEIRGVYEPTWMRRFYESVLSVPAGRRNLEDALERVRRESPMTPVLPVVEAAVRDVLSEPSGHPPASQ